MTSVFHCLRLLVLPALAAVLLAACGPIDVYYRQGAPVQRLESDTLSCKVDALKKAPVANQLRQQPATYYPGERICRDGSCWTRPGHWVEGRIYTVDINQNLRQRLEQSCMAAKGYQQLPIRRCTMKEASARLAYAPDRLAPLSQDACVWVSPSDELRILNP